MRVHKKYSQYTVVTNEIFKHQLSLEAIGLYLYIANKPDNWDFSIAGTSTQVQNGKDSIRSAIKELEEKGFLKRTQERKPDGKMGDSIWFITDTPSEKPSSVKPSSGFSRLVNNKEVNKKRESGSHSLSFSKVEMKELEAQYGVTRKAILNSLSKYRLNCEVKHEEPSIAGGKLWLTRERWTEDDWNSERTAQETMKGF